jgi:nucleotide-binding universal stress UspA family protein
MMTFSTFVVPLDGSPYAERALPIATALAERAGGNLMLVSVADRTGPYDPKDYLDEVTATPRPVPVEKVSVTCEPDAPVASEAIAKIVLESDERIVCMTTHGRRGLRWALLGSVAEEIVHRSDRPTLLVGHHCRDDFLTDARYLLACVDGPESSAGLAPAVTHWAKRLDLEVHAAKVVHPLDVETSEHSEKVLNPIVEALGGADRVTATLLTATYPEGALSDYASDLKAAIVATSSHSRTGMARFALGSMTMGLVHHAHCPVLMVPMVMTDQAAS